MPVAQGGQLKGLTLFASVQVGPMCWEESLCFDTDFVWRHRGSCQHYASKMELFNPSWKTLWIMLLGTWRWPPCLFYPISLSALSSILYSFCLLLPICSYILSLLFMSWPLPVGVAIALKVSESYWFSTLWVWQSFYILFMFWKLTIPWLLEIDFFLHDNELSMWKKSWDYS